MQRLTSHRRALSRFLAALVVVLVALGCLGCSCGDAPATTAAPSAVASGAPPRGAAAPTHATRPSQPRHELPAGDHQAVSLGTDGGCALDTSRRLWCWGPQGECEWSAERSDRSRPPDGSSFAAVSGSPHRGCGVRTSGELVCWGCAAGAEEQVPMRGWKKIAAADRQGFCGITSDGRRWGCLGFHASGPKNDVPPPASLLDVDMRSFEDEGPEVSSGCGIVRDGALRCWGHAAWNRDALEGVDACSLVAMMANDRPCVARDRRIECRGSPGQSYDLPAPATKLVAGRAHVCAMSAGEVACFGDEPHSAVRGPVRDVAAWDDATCIVDPSGGLRCVGPGY
ncbi:MAG: hypothetical protein IT373_34810 [Polyangiaceae bacterium]|nr:hypothetical protein [Polyangiaceae bacterium]